MNILNIPNYLGGFEIYENAQLMQEWFRHPRSKKRRIRNKWKKNRKNWRPITNRAYRYGNKLICHPIFARKLREAI